MPITLAKVNAELASRGIRALLTNGDGYFYFRGGETADWLDKTVQVKRINDLTLEQWVAEYQRLKGVNAKLAGMARKPARKQVRS